MADSDTNPDHFDWLVQCRSLNQKSTVDLYRILKDNRQKLNRLTELQTMAQGLAGAAFSLWRSVFLSDVSDDMERHSADLLNFLVSLIADNTVLYQTDKNTRNWSFRYYLENAEFRLEKMSGTSDEIRPLIHKATTSEKERWLNAQTALDIAIRGFREAVARAPQVSS